MSWSASGRDSSRVFDHISRPFSHSGSVSLVITCDQLRLVGRLLAESWQHYLKVDLLRISCGGGEHPPAGKSTLHIKGSLGNPRWEEMKIHGNLLAVHLEHIKSSLYDLPDSELWLFDWKAGDSLAVGYTSPANDQSLTDQIKVLEGRRN
jgi:hypothetical protein